MKRFKSKIMELILVETPYIYSGLLRPRTNSDLKEFATTSTKKSRKMDTQRVMRDVSRGQQAVGGRGLHQVVLAARACAVRHRVAPHALRQPHQEAARRPTRQSCFSCRSTYQTWKQSLELRNDRRLHSKC